MNIMSPTVEVYSDLNTKEILNKIESIARICYRSEDKIKEGSSEEMFKKLIKNNHLAMIEFHDIVAVVNIDRILSQQITRHRIASYAQESTRYCSYKNGVDFISPCYWHNKPELFDLWLNGMASAEKYYLTALEMGATPQEARAFLPASTRTKIAMKFNLREWKHFIELRCESGAHPQMKELAYTFYHVINKLVPGLLADVAFNPDIKILPFTIHAGNNDVSKMYMIRTEEND